MEKADILKLMKDIFPDVEEQQGGGFWFMETDRGREFCLAINDGTAYLSGFNNAGLTGFPQVDLNKNSIKEAVISALKGEYNKAMILKRHADKRIDRSKMLLQKLGAMELDKFEVEVLLTRDNEYHFIEVSATSEKDAKRKAFELAYGDEKIQGEPIPDETVEEYTRHVRKAI